MAMRVSSELDRILNTAISYHNLFGSYLWIENIGVLFEPELKLDFTRMLDSYSQNNLLLVKWEGEIVSDNTYFLTKENGIKTNIKLKPYRNMKYKELLNFEPITEVVKFSRTSESTIRKHW